MTQYLRGNLLWSRVLSVTESALDSGALEPIPTRSAELREEGVQFQVRVVGNLARKSRAVRERVKQQPLAQDVNPFLPHDEALYVGELTPRYRCLLNKFNVVDHHILMATTEFAEQLEPLTREDFLAAAICVQAQEGLVFYNGGAEAGASVRHKHLQMIPLPLSPSASFPFVELFASLSISEDEITVCDSLPFEHSLSRTAYTSDESKLDQVAEENTQRYRRMMDVLSLSKSKDGLMPPYNLLLTRDFMWAVPRRQEKSEGIAVNALGFAGALLAKDEQQLEQLKTLGGTELLTQVVCKRGRRDY